MPMNGFEILFHCSVVFAFGTPIVLVALILPPYRMTRSTSASSDHPVMVEKVSRCRPEC